MLQILTWNPFNFPGLKLEYDLSKPFGQRLTSIQVRCQRCLIPKYEPLHQGQIYNIVVNSYTLSGGNNFSVIVDNVKNVRKGPLNFAVLRDFLKHRSPIFEQVEGRINIQSGKRDWKIRIVFNFSTLNSSK